MPSKTKSAPAARKPRAPKPSAEAKLIAEGLQAVAEVRGDKPAIALLAPLQTGSALPFAPDSTAPYGDRTDAGKRDVAAAIANAKVAGASGNEMRATFGSKLTGPARRKVLREHGFTGTAYVARSYDAYGDGDPRAGSRHAREHGALAVERRAEARTEALGMLSALVRERLPRTRDARSEYATALQAGIAHVQSLGASDDDVAQAVARLARVA